jgi:hypothetical protein
MQDLGKLSGHNVWILGCKDSIIAESKLTP